LQWIHVYLWPVHVGSDFIGSQIGRQTDVFMDSSQNLSLSDILSAPYQQMFKPHQTNGFNFGMTSDVIWLRIAFEAMTIQLDDGSRVQAMISVGVGQLSEAEHEKSFFDRVDRAIYKAKDSGRNRVLRAA
jgi:GGDEF domain-containing protein